MAKLNPYLNFNGNTEEAFNFYKFIFGGEFIIVQRFRGNPGCEGMRTEDLDKIMHIALPVGGGILMGTDALEPMPKAEFGNAMSLSIDAESEIEANRLYENLSVGGIPTMPLEKMFWGALFGMVTDKFGVQWMVNYDFNTEK